MWTGFVNTKPSQGKVNGNYKTTNFNIYFTFLDFFFLKKDKKLYDIPEAHTVVRHTCIRHSKQLYVGSVQDNISNGTVVRLFYNPLF